MNRSLFLLLAVLTGCGGYANRSQAFRHALDAGSPDAALERVNRELGVERAEGLPASTEEETPLLLLERATILQSMGRYDLSARDFQRADKALDILDLTGDTAGEISRYLFSDDATLYKSPPHEKLLLNTLNMINYLVRGDSSGAKVEARRFTINRRYLDDQGRDEDDEDPSFLAIGSFLSGVAFEMAGEWDIAMRHYADAFVTGGIPTLEPTLRRLWTQRSARDPRVATLMADSVAGATPSGSDAQGPQASTMAPTPLTIAEAPESTPIPATALNDTSTLIAAAAGETTPKPASSATRPPVETTLPSPAQPAGHGTLLVVTQTGMAPHKVPRRIPLANAIIIASQPGYGARLSAAERRRAQGIAAEGLVKWVNYPDLTRAHDAHGPVTVAIDGTVVPGGLGLDVGLRVSQQFARGRGAILAAAITRLITRAVVGNVARKVGSGSQRDSAAGFLLGLAIEGAMTASDTPDTRSWVTLPARIHVARSRVPVGPHQVIVRFRGQTRTQKIEIERDGFVVLNFSDLR